MEDVSPLLFTNPATGEIFGQVEQATPAAVAQALEDLRTAAPVWRARSVADRVRVLRRFQHTLIEATEEITEVINADCGKSRQDALIEVFITLDMLQTYLRRAPDWLRRRPVPTGLYLFKRATVEPQPYGVVAVIAPWNYPFALSLPPVLAALLAGNTVLLKPSEVTAATGVLIEHLFARTPELAPYVRVVHGAGEVGAAVVECRPDFIFLTGSTGTGQKISAAAAPHLTPVACELGGKDAMIVLEDADLEAAAHWGAWGSAFNAGQTCMAVERAYVVAPVYAEFVRRAVAETERLQVGFSTAAASPFYVGPMSDSRQVKIVAGHLQDALTKGARLLTGGQQTEMFFTPGVLVDVDHSMLLMQEETFGPLLPIIKVADEGEAIRLANNCRYGLGASVWSRDLARAQRVADQLEVGSVVINDTIAQFAVPLLPFGGVKDSGSGRTHGEAGLLQFTRPRATLIGQAPVAWDIATVARQPGNYRLLEMIMQVVFGVGLKQKARPLTEAIGAPPLPRPRAVGFGLGLATVAALAAVVLRPRRRSRP
jgi:acyl-CoA reductase-like NAD-dependent aldehyde dehydrogenase